MFTEILQAIIQSATEFLPVSSSGHLALADLILANKPNLFFFTTLHLASLLAVLIFTRKEIKELITFNPKYLRLWLYLIIATIPAMLFGLLFKDVIEGAFSSLFFLGFAFIFTGIILFATKFSKVTGKLNLKKSLFIGLFQAIALFPGVSRSGMTISSGMFAGLEKEKAARFSFLMFIPVSLGAFLLELKNFYINSSIIIAFFVCTILSLLFLNLLTFVIKKDKFWLFSIYCWIIGILSLILYFR